MGRPKRAEPSLTVLGVDRRLFVTVRDARAPDLERDGLAGRGRRGVSRLPPSGLAGGPRIHSVAGSTRATPLAKPGSADTRVNQVDSPTTPE